MEHLLQLYIYLPFFAFVLSLFIPGTKEKILTAIAIGSIAIHVAAIAAITLFWAMNQFDTMNLKHVVLYKSEKFEFFTNFYFDRITAVYAWVGAVITLSVTIFSKYYMHRDEGFKRFFNTLLFFYLGYSFVIFSGNFETLFIGWEIMGITSFLLISYYGDRYLPVKNGLKIISLYRLGDVALILGMWMSHHIFHKNITFHELNTAGFLTEILQQHGMYIQVLVLLIVLAVAIKSAQLPFSSWLPRAMEGPTVSSAIFYGSLSVHLGVFLLLRSYPLWQENLSIKILLIAIGLSTSIIASSIARVQSSVKTQIAYSSITQIGIMFIEAALGLHLLVLIHFAGNAFLRTYQLLVSPSVLSYRIHEQVFSFMPAKYKDSNTFTAKVKNTIFLLGVKEWNLDVFMYRFLWHPFKWFGARFRFMDRPWSILLIGAIYASGMLSLLFENKMHELVYELLQLVYATLAFIYIVKAFAERNNALHAWSYIFISQLFVALSVSLNVHAQVHQVFIYLSGILLSGITGFYCLYRVKSIDNDISLNYFHGYAYEKPFLAVLFFVSCLGLLGFPFTPTFIGIDLMFIYIHKHQYLLLVLIALGFVLIEISALRIYARIFLGQHKKAYHPIAYRSS
jgi:NADH-quinone oxidoreductase subunit L